jgi:Protein of unknown function (DUF1569).
MKSSFDQTYTNEVVARINQLTPTTTPGWGKMNVGQMLAHCNVAYDMAYTDKYPQPNFLVRWMLTRFVKPAVVGQKAYQKNGRTAPAFLVDAEQDFEKEKKKLIDYVKQTQSLGANHFEQKESNSFGKLTAEEWSNLFTKHLDHHLTQFGV